MERASIMDSDTTVSVLRMCGGYIPVDDCFP